MEKKAKVQDCVHNYVKSKGTTHPINHCECNSDVSDWLELAVTMETFHSLLLVAKQTQQVRK